MKTNIKAGLAVGLSFFAINGLANASLITYEDFESGVSGWNYDTAIDGGSNFTSFLGWHGDKEIEGFPQSLHKKYTLSGIQTEVTVSFDFYGIDNWNSESFNIYVNGIQLSSKDYGTEYLFGGVSAPGDDHGFSDSADQGFKYSFSYITNDTSLCLRFDTTIDYSSVTKNDPKSMDIGWGIDNVSITDNAGEPVPEPASMLLFASGLIGLVGARLRRKSR